MRSFLVLLSLLAAAACARAPVGSANFRPSEDGQLYGHCARLKHDAAACNCTTLPEGSDGCLGFDRKSVYPVGCMLAGPDIACACVDLDGKRGFVCDP
jgi:hypothetical protein